MTKNSRRKNDARQRAAHHSEPYTRALRATRVALDIEEAAPGSAFEIATWKRDLARMRAVQQLVQARGWVVAPIAQEAFDTAGRAVTADAFFDYPAAFSAPSITGDRFDDYLDDLDEDLAEDGPRRPVCGFGRTDAGGLTVVVETAGNWQGCRHHRVVAHTVALNAPDSPDSPDFPGALPPDATTALPPLLDTVESTARELDPARLLACTLEGPCGARARRRAERRHRHLAYSRAMVEAGKKFSAEEMAELLAWEREHLGGRTLGPDGDPLGTSDWPGWIPLIGPPPWNEAPESDDPVPDLLPTRSLHNDGVPIDLLRPIFERRDLSSGAIGLWSMLVSYYWSCEADRTITQLHDHRPQDAAETDQLLAELAAAGMVTVSPFGVVTINPDHLGELAPRPDR